MSMGGIACSEESGNLVLSLLSSEKGRPRW